MNRTTATLLVALTTGVIGCGDDDTRIDSGKDASIKEDASMMTESPLPSSSADYVAWLGGNGVDSWFCDAEAQPPVSPSPHGDNRICINKTLRDALGNSGNFPVGSAAVKITYDKAGNETARYLDARTSDTDGAEGWYFMRLAGGQASPAGMGGEDSVGGCVSCHTGASRDFVYRTPK